MIAEHAPEAVAYLLEVARFRRTRSKLLRKALAERIVSYFIEEKAPNAINIAGSARSTIARAVQQLDTSGLATVTAPTPFDESAIEVAKMARDAFRRFQSTDGFRICALLLGAFGPLEKRRARGDASTGVSIIGSNQLGGESLVTLERSEDDVQM